MSDNPSHVAMVASSPRLSGRTRLAMEVFYLAAVLLPSAQAQTSRWLTPDKKQLALAGTVAMIGWYLLWRSPLTKRLAWRPGTRTVVYFGIAVAIWFGLVVIYAPFTFAMWALMFQLAFNGPQAQMFVGAAVFMAVPMAARLVRSGFDTTMWSLLGGIVPVGLFVILAVLFKRASDERGRLAGELGTTRQQLAAAERQAGVLAERQRLAREIHDTLAQGFASIVMQLEAAEANARTGRSGRSYTDQALRTAGANLEEARRMVWDLRPEVLEDGTLADALGRLATSFAADTGVAAEVVVTGEPVPLPTTAEVVLLRVAQEALTNVRRHAAATRVTVTLSFLSTAIGLDVRDDGSGFDPARVTPSAGGRLGLQSMRERVTGLGGEFTIETAPGEGTTVAASLPVVVVVEPSPEATGALVARTAAKA